MLSIDYTLIRLGEQLDAANVRRRSESRQGIKYFDDQTEQERAAGDAIFASFDWGAGEAAVQAEIQQERSDLADFRDKYQARLDQIQVDIELLPNATTNQLRQIIGRILVTQRQELKAFKAILKG